MKKSIATILAICFAVSTLVLAFLWTSEKNNKDDLRELAQAGATHAYTQFAMYQDNGDIRRYWDGVASFRNLSASIPLYISRDKQFNVII